MYWDGETTPSVEAPIGDFFGLGNGIYYRWESLMLSAGADKALNSYFPMPYAKHARITITDEGKLPLNHLYWNIDYRRKRGAAARRYALLSRRVPAGTAQQRLDGQLVRER